MNLVERLDHFEQCVAHFPEDIRLACREAAASLREQQQEIERLEKELKQTAEACSD